jgi:hypothetical protein
VIGETSPFFQEPHRRPAGPGSLIVSGSDESEEKVHGRFPINGFKRPGLHRRTPA